jgi:hypothetical protein
MSRHRREAVRRDCIHPEQVVQELHHPLHDSVERYGVALRQK